MQACRLFITGAAGSGTTTLGRALAQLWSAPLHDTDDYFWVPSDPPFTRRRPTGERLALAEAMFLPRRHWILTGSMIGWGGPITPRLQAVVFLHLDPAERLRRLAAREAALFGAAIAPGGRQHDQHGAFMDWAAGYDDPSFSGRSLAQHRDWLGQLTCPVLELDSAAPVAELVAAITQWPVDV